MTFQDFNFDPHILEGLDAMNYTSPTPIQEQAMPVILQGRDLIACAQTGTGKTAAYILPVLQRILHTPHRHLHTLIVAPTRELAQQIDQQLQGFTYFCGVSSIPVYGGGDGAGWDVQKKAMMKGADIVVATPGRLLSQLLSGSMVLDHLQCLILDEADRMLDMGFYDDIMRIMKFLPEKRQTLLFSATMPPKIRTLCTRILHQPEEISIAISKPAEGIVQQAYLAYDAQKLPLLKKILTQKSFETVIIFASTKEKVKKLDSELRRNRIKTKAFHSDLEQAEREEIMREFKSKQLPVLIGTDILSRGIDVEGIDLVINYDTPHDPEDYVHRIGRTARAASTGTAITFINEKDQRYFLNIENLIGYPIPKLDLPEGFDPGPKYQPELKRESSFRGKGFKRSKKPVDRRR